ncbi:uncharacterized protein DS421_4g116630 [Arachis hypogaea]|nr:uncharacterized protein DS421_4g116630 [Arachis hypogaea]
MQLRGRRPWLGEPGPRPKPPRSRSRNRFTPLLLVKWWVKGVRRLPLTMMWRWSSLPLKEKGKRPQVPKGSSPSWRGISMHPTL